MSKTIKVIDLYNKIDSGEEVPKKIKNQDGEILKYDSRLKSYVHEYLPSSGWSVSDTYLNDTVEIIEEQEDIDIQKIKEFDDKVISTEERLKIDELVQAVKQLDKKIKEK